MEVNSHNPEELQKTIKLQNEHIQQLTEYNAQCVENTQRQNKQIELLSRQLTDSHNQCQQLLQQLQQQQSRDGDKKHQYSSLSSPVLLNGCADGSAAEAESRVVQLEEALREMRAKLEESERQRQLSDEQAEKSRRLYESEISLLKMQLTTFEEDFQAERRSREATAATLEQVRAELVIAQRQVSRPISNSLCFIMQYNTTKLLWRCNSTDKFVGAVER